jgi:hypothetical protein
MALGAKKRSPYDKIIKHAVELLRQELSPLHDNQQRIITQNEKNTTFLRQIWDKLEQRGAQPPEEDNPPS